MQVALVRQVLRRRQRDTRSDDTLHRRVVRQVQEQRRALHRAVLREVVAEETSRLHVHSHGAEHHGEIVLVVIVDVLACHQTCLTANLCSELALSE